MTKRSNKSRISKNDDLYITQQQKFNFKEFEDELDDTFLLEYKNINRNKKNKKQTEINKALQKELTKELKAGKGKKTNSFILVVGMSLVIMILLLFIMHHFITFDHKIKPVEKTKEVTIVDDNYLFLGDSITDQYDLEEYYKDLPVVNSGISGNATKDILDNMEERVYRYNPSKVFLLIGTNDIERKIEKDKIIENIEKIVLNIKENRPYAKIYVESIYPVNENKSGSGIRTNDTIISINKKLKEICSKEKIKYINLYSELIDDDNLKNDYSEDGLHLNDNGYKVVTEKIKKYLKK